jgi:hypothetical protein
MSRKKNSMKKAAEGIAEDVVDPERAKMNKLKNMEKRSKAKLTKTIEDNTEDAKKKAQIASDFLNKQKFKYNNLYYSVKEFENDVYKVEGFRVIVRAAPYAKIKKYTYKKRCSSNNTIKYFVEQRLKRLTDSEYTFAIPYRIMADGTLSDLRVLDAADRAAMALIQAEED